MLDASPPDWVTVLTALFSLVMVVVLARGLWGGRRGRDDRDGPDRR